MVLHRDSVSVSFFEAKVTAETIQSEFQTDCTAGSIQGRGLIEYGISNLKFCSILVRRCSQGSTAISLRNMRMIEKAQRKKNRKKFVN